MKSQNRIPQQFIVRIAVKNEAGVVTGEREVITYAGLLAVAHELGLTEIDTSIEEMPTEANGHVAVVRAVAKGKPGTFTGIGDASPQNVNRKVVRHLLRVAETRAKARALRDLCNINMLALEELGGDDDIELEPHVRQQQQPHQPRREERRVVPISDAQKRALWRKALTLGHEGDAAQRFLTERLGVDPARATREQASRLLDALSDEERQLRANGSAHAAE
ncbi:MAG: hypothetical protein U0234_00725 [Sandaracinus sp.]